MLAAWSTPSSEFSIGGTALDNRATGTTTLITDLASTALYLRLWCTLGSINTAAGASVRFELREKRGSVYAQNPVAEVTVPILVTGASVKDLACRLQLPGPFAYGIYWTNNAGVNSAASGNALFFQTYSEEGSP